VPADVTTRRQASDSGSAQCGQSRGLAGALLAAIKVWERPQQVDSSANDLVAHTAKRTTQVRMNRV